VEEALRPVVSLHTLSLEADRARLVMTPPPPRRSDKRSARAAAGAAAPGEPIWLFGLHTVTAALRNPRRIRHRLLVTRNALQRLPADALAAGPAPEETDVKSLSRLLGPDAVHQGVALLADPLAPRALDDLGEERLVVRIDQVTDPHNVGAIMRSAVAFGAGALITTSRHSPTERGVLAKAASGALDQIDHIVVGNLAVAVTALAGRGYRAVALDSAGDVAFEALPPVSNI
jgi:23S rRNA (guanosine2251-2'-O)-methyltransferase